MSYIKKGSLSEIQLNHSIRLKHLSDVVEHLLRTFILLSGDESRTPLVLDTKRRDKYTSVMWLTSIPEV